MCWLGLTPVRPEAPCLLLRSVCWRVSPLEMNARRRGFRASGSTGQFRRYEPVGEQASPTGSAPFLRSSWPCATSEDAHVSPLPFAHPWSRSNVPCQCALTMCLDAA